MVAVNSAVGLAPHALSLLNVLRIVEFDDLLIQSLILLLGTFAIAYEVHRRRVRGRRVITPAYLR